MLCTNIAHDKVQRNVKMDKVKLKGDELKSALNVANFNHSGVNIPSLIKPNITFRMSSANKIQHGYNINNSSCQNREFSPGSHKSSSLFELNLFADPRQTCRTAINLQGNPFVWSCSNTEIIRRYLHVNVWKLAHVIASLEGLLSRPKNSFGNLSFRFESCAHFECVIFLSHATFQGGSSRK